MRETCEQLRSFHARARTSCLGSARVDKRRQLPLLLLLLMLTWHVAGGPVHAQLQPARLFESTVQRVFREKCGACHGEKRAEAELKLLTAKDVLQGGESGQVIDPKHWAQSLIWRRIAADEMPPKDSPQLSDEQRRAIRSWLEGGALFTESASSQPLTHHDIVPMMLLRCTVCHGGRRREAGLDLRTRESMLRGGKSGPALKLGKPQRSLLIKRIHSGEMPPRRKLVDVSVKPMTDEELGKLSDWIEQGAPLGETPHAAPPVDPGSSKRHWAFQTPSWTSPPEVQRRREAASALDAFLLAELENRGIGFSPPAPRRTWLRRVTLDLTGLPPTPADVRDFLADASPLARELVVDRLLASPRYGERWAQVWLDVAGYADSEGSQNEDRIRADIFRFRDYVIRAFNADKSYRRFLLEQIAGDELANYRDPTGDTAGVSEEVFDNLVATGFLRTAPDRTFAGITNFVPDRLELIADEIQILSTSVMGLTIHCARCHSHKFDPISQRDYFRLSSLLKGAYDEHDWLGPEKRKLVVMPKPELARLRRHNADLQLRMKTLMAQRKTSSAPDEKALNQQIKSLEQQKLKPWRIRALWSRGQPSPTYLLRRGDYSKPGPLVLPAAPTALQSPDNPLTIQPQSFGESRISGRRLALARWLTHPAHPLTARVIVNRIWAEHFGQGLVATLDNFGLAGESPSHPELLDRLASDFMRDGWSIKRLHRRIVLSRAYAQSSRLSTQSLHHDPDGRLLSRMALRRMNAEMVRDSLVQLSGRLREHPFGPPDPVEVSASGLSISKAIDQSWRRSIYVLHRRTQMPSILESFDSPQMSPNCVRRRESIVATQALHLMNNAMIQSLADHFAERVVREAKSTDPIVYAFRLAWNRPPTPQELLAAQTAYEQLAAAWVESGQAAEAAEKMALKSFCHSLMNSAAFIYID